MTSDRPRASRLTPARVAGFAFGVLLAAGLSASAATSAEMGTRSRPQGQARSLADFAATVRLNREVAGGAQQVVISDANIKEAATWGTISSGGGVFVEGSEWSQVKVQPPGTEDRDKAWRKKLDDQNERLRSLEQGLSDFDRKVADRRASTPQRGYLAQDRPGGVRSAAEITREQVAADIAAERARLDSLRKSARRDGVEIDK